MTTVNLNNPPTVIDQTLSQQVIHKISGTILPIDVINAFFQLKPKHMAKCCRITKEIKALITTENDTNRQYWNGHVIRRWGATKVEAKLPSEPSFMGIELFNNLPPPIPLVCVAQKIKEYSLKYLTEKRALKYFSIVEKHDPFSFKHLVGDESNAVSYAIMTIKQVLPYLKGESPKAELFYLAGIYSTVMLYTQSYHLFLEALQPQGIDPNFRQCVSWFEKAAEKGHMESAYQLAYHLIDQLVVDKSHFHKDATQAIKWLRIASDRGHSDAISLLQTIEEDPMFNATNDYQVTLGLIRDMQRGRHKRHLEETQEAGPPTKKQKRL